MLTGFKNFLLRGNVVDLAIAVVIGSAFAALVKAFGDAFIQPILKAVPTGDAVGGLTFPLRHGSKELEAATSIDVSAFLNAVVIFLVTAAVVYFAFVAPMNALAERRKRGQEPEPTAPSEEVLLLTEIRDLLTRQGQGGQL